MIENVYLEELTNPLFVKPARVWYEEDGVKKSWEIVRAHNSVAILIYNKDSDSFVLVKQFRPAVFLSNNDGYSYELCAGIIDKDKSDEQIAVEEVLEETGYVVKPSDLIRITSFYTSVGFAGSKQTLYFVEVANANRSSSGGGIDTEKIEVVHLPLSEARAFMQDEALVKTTGLLFAFMWYFEKRV